jgi:alkanesulfonate monooxygenase SsuD/methylene tetrahydromethanopterin reductase-like flavin-dependent oxidoreductase (luciferase family)
LPDRPPQLIGAALSEQGARRVARWADGLLTTCTDLGKLRRIVAAFRESGGEDKRVHLKIELSWARDEAEALRQAHEQWRFLLAGRGASEELPSPAAFEAATTDVTPEEVRGAVLVSADVAQHVSWLRERLAPGIATLDLHQVGRYQREFVDVFGREVLPALRQDMAVAEGPAP